MAGLSNSQKTDLEQPVKAAKELVKNWDKWGFNKGRSFSPHKGDSAEEKKVLKTLDHSAILKAIGADHSGNAGNNNQSKGRIDKFEVQDFVKNETSEAKQAVKDYNAWLKKNPNASDTAKAMAQSAAIIEGNTTLLSAGSSDPSKLVNGKVTEGDLKAIGKSGGISKALSGAARMWENPGLFKMMETAGTDQLAHNPSGHITSKNAGAFLKEDTFTTDTKVEKLLQQAALAQATAGVDTSKIGPDLFKQDSKGKFVNLGKYSPAQKAAVLAQLTHVEQVLKSGQNAGAALPNGHHVPNVLDTPQMQQAGINPNLGKTLKQVQTDIGALQSDPSVQKYLADHTDTALQKITSSDPAFESVMQKSLSHFESGATLKTDLSGTHQVTTYQHVGRGEKPVIKQVKNDLAYGVNKFVQQGAFFEAAFGKGTTPGKQVDLNKILHKSGSYNDVLNYYKNNIVSGKTFTDEIKNQGNLGAGATAFGQQVQNFSMVLDTADVKKNSAALGKNYLQQLEKHLAQRSGAGKNFVDAFTTNGHFDKAKTTKIVEELMQKNPEALAGSDGKLPTVSAVVSAIGGVVGMIRGGMIAYDALKNAGLFHLGGPAKGNFPTKVYHSGAMHALAAVFSGVELGLSIKINGKSPTGIATDIADGLAVAAFGLIGGGFYTQQSNNLKGAQANFATRTRTFLEARGHYNDAENATNTAQHEVDAARAALNHANQLPQNNQAAQNERTAAINAANQRLGVAQHRLTEANNRLAHVERIYSAAGAARQEALRKYDIYKAGGTGLTSTFSETKNALKNSYQPNTLDKAAIDVGAGLFGASFIISGAVDIAGGAKSGDKLTQGLDYATGIPSILSGAGYLGEAALSGAAAAGADIAAGAITYLDAVTGPLGAAALVAGGILGVVTAAKQDIQGDHQISHTTTKTISTLQQYGINGGPIQPGDAPVHGR